MDATIQSDQNIRILQIYNIYRFFLALLLLLSFLTGATTTQLGNHDPALFLYTSILLLAYSLFIIFVLKPERTFSQRQRLLSTLFIIDIVCIAILTYSSRGVLSGLGLLHLVTIAAGSILIVGRMSTLLAAIASIATIYSEVYLSFTRNVLANQYIQSGLLGALLFSASLYLQGLAVRMRRSARLTEEQASSILSLEQLNHLIIQRMRTGIVVIGPTGNVITANDAAHQMLASHGEHKPSNHDSTALNIPAPLLSNLMQWKENKEIRTPAFKAQKDGPQLQANFAYLTGQSDSSILVFIEDSSQIIQRVRQMKLASLGRLTASIAHEIRNPLGAISHASQLLKESETLKQTDQRLLDIILTHCARVKLIIDDVLHMSQHKKDNSERIKLFSWIKQYVEEYCETHQVQGTISIDIEPKEIEVRVITSQLEQILNNLVENGLRYSKKATNKENLLIKGRLDNKAKTIRPILEIIDDGPGIEAKTEEHLFEPFYTTENTGTGLGLYISKELCEANQAQLSYRRTSAGKSCFSIHFAHPDRNID